MRLLYRFFEPKSGEILIAGQNIKDLDLDCLREAISVVPQVSISLIFGFINLIVIGFVYIVVFKDEIEKVHNGSVREFSFSFLIIFLLV